MTSFLSIGLMVPFRIYANGSLSAPFVGYNIYRITYDFEEYFNGYQVDLDLSGLRFNCNSYNSSGACSLWLQPSSYDGSVDGTIYANTTQTGTSTNEIYQVDLILDNDYIGYVNITQSNRSNNYYVNGNKISFTVTNPTNLTQLTVNNYSLQLKEDSDLEFLMWQYPIESYNFVSYWLGLGKLPIELFQDSYYTYPVFELNTNDQIWRSSMSSGQSQIVIFGIDKYITASNFDSFFTIPSGFSVEYENIGLIPLTPTTFGRIVKYTFTNNNSSSASVILTYKGSDTRIIPIYSRNSREKFISTDFALQFGLSNKLLENLDIIANGTTGSSQTASSVTSESQSLTDVSDDIHDMESTFNNDLNNNLQAIDTTITPGTFGSSFLASSSWVKTQFDQLTSNTPFGSVLSFSLILGLGLLIVGRALK